MRNLPEVPACGESAATPEYFLTTLVTVEITLTVVFYCWAKLHGASRA